MEEKQIEEFLEKCEDEYEALMVTDWDNIKTIDKLHAIHTANKLEVESLLAQIWTQIMGSKKIPSNLEQLVAARIDENYEIITMFFQNKSSEELTEQENVNVDEEREENPHFSRYFSNHRKQSKHENGDTNEIAIGIDLGTTNSCVCVLQSSKGRVEIVPNIKQRNAKTTPSYVAFQKDGSESFGMVAKNGAYKNPESTIYDAKRMIGRCWSDKKFQNDMKMKVWPFEVIEENGKPKVKAGGRTRYPHEISARLLCRFRKMAEEYLQVRPGTIKKAVITVPAYFSEPQRRATNEAAMCAGLEVLNILSEPTAACIAYYWERKLQGNKKVLIYDLGGGTFDVAVAIVQPNNVQIIGVHGDTHLGGQDFDQLLMGYCIRKFKQATGIDLIEGKYSRDETVRYAAIQALSRLRLQCEEAKEWLSSTEHCTVEVPFIIDKTHLSIDVSRDVLEMLCMPIVHKTLKIVDLALSDAIANETSGIRGKKDIDEIIMIGGSTRMPQVKRMVSNFFGGKQLCVNIDPDQAVAFGAAIQADLLLRRGMKRRGSCPASPTIQDVTPRTVGIQCDGDEFSKVIPRNTRIPCEHEEIYTTSVDNETFLLFTVRQGERDKASENILLGEFSLNGIPMAPAGQEEVKVTMIINEMGILQVKAVSLTTGLEDSITITSSNQLSMSDEEIKQLSDELNSALSI